jgi:hypothetical protein
MGFDHQILPHLAADKFLFLIYRKLQVIYLEDFMKDVQATEGAFSPQKKTTSTSNMKF